MATRFRKRRKLTENEKLENLRCQPEWWWGDDSREYWHSNALIEVYGWEENSEAQQLISEIEVGSL